MLTLRRTRAAGFSLLEAMIALVIIMVGLLGVAGLQALGVRNSAQAHIRTLAEVDAQSLAATLRANSVFWSNVDAANAGDIAKVAWNNGAATVSSKNTTVLPTSQANCSTGSCTPAQAAWYALNKWANQATELPDGATATIKRATGVSNAVFTVYVTWKEKTMKQQGLTTGTASSADATNQTQVVVQP